MIDDDDLGLGPDGGTSMPAAEPPAPMPETMPAEPAWPTPNERQIDLLRKSHQQDPRMLEFFERKFGPGSASKHLGVGVSETAQRASATIDAAVRAQTAERGAAAVQQVADQSLFGGWGRLTDPSDRQAAAEDELASAQTMAPLSRSAAGLFERTAQAVRDSSFRGPVHYLQRGVMEVAAGLTGSYAEDQEKRLQRAEKVVRGEAEQPQSSLLRSSVDKLVQSIADFAIAKPVEYAGIVGAYAGRAVGADVDPARNMVTDFGKRIAAKAKEVFPDDVARQQQFVTQVSQGIGSTAAFYGTGLLVRLMGAGERGMLAGIALSGAAGNVPDEFDKATKALENGTTSEWNRFINMLANTGLGMTEALPFAPGFARSGSTGVGAAVQRAGSQMVEEAGQEFGQKLGTNISAQQLIDSSRDPYEGVLEGVAVAGITGGLFGAATSQRVGRDEQRREAKARAGGQPTATDAAPIGTDTRAIAPKLDEEAAPLRPGEGAVRTVPTPEEPTSEALERVRGLLRPRAQPAQDTASAPADGQGEAVAAPIDVATEPAVDEAPPREPTDEEVEADLPARAADIEQFYADREMPWDLDDTDVRAVVRNMLRGEDVETALESYFYGRHDANAAARGEPVQPREPAPADQPAAEPAGSVQGQPAAAEPTGPDAPVGRLPEVGGSVGRPDGARAPDGDGQPGRDAGGQGANVTDDDRRAFARVLAGKTPRGQWRVMTGAGLTPAQMDSLINEAVADGRLVMRDGVPRRTKKAGKIPEALQPQAEPQRPRGIMDVAQQMGMLQIVPVGDPRPAPTMPPALADIRPGVDERQPLVERMATSGFKTIVEARQFAKASGIRATGKALDEMIEQSIVDVARGIVARETSPEDAYRELVNLYARQPNLGTRTSTSVANQAYSTPMPLAYLASRLAGVSASNVVYEPSAGNGALLIEADPARQVVLANELDPKRADALKAQGFRVTTKDATDEGLAREIAKAGPIGAIIENPPFGAVREGGKSKAWTIGGWKTTQVDHAIALRSLDALASDGKAVLILGGIKATDTQERRKGYRGQAKREFYARLYGQFNVVDHFTVSGDLYTKQGASWPVDVVVIDGRGKSQRTLPAASPPVIYDSWDRLAEKLSNVTDDEGRGARGEAGAVDSGIARPERGDGAGVVDAPLGGRDELATGSTDDAGGVRDGDIREPVGARDVGEQPARVVGDEPAGDRDGRAVAQQPAARQQRVKREPKGGQAQYDPASNAISLDTLIPVNMASAAQSAMARITEKHGSVDQLVADRLGYPMDADGMFIADAAGNPVLDDRGRIMRPFSAEQIDALAAAIDNAERGAAFILGDQTGIGKGRVVAGMLRYAMKRGITPVLVTEKIDLYGDMYRDLRDIGVNEMLGREPRMLMTNSGIPPVPMDEDAVSWKQEADEAVAAGKKAPAARGRFLKSLSTAQQAVEMRAMVAGQGEFDIVFTTYDQMSTVAGKDTARRQFLDAIAPRAFVAFDESHNAGGAAKTGWESKDKPKNRADFARELAAKAGGVIFSSATYAKRPDVMDLYARTDMGRAVDNPADLPVLIQRGGVPMQQVVATMLSDAGQYLRRERSFDGVEYAIEPVPVDQGAYSQFSDAIRAVFKFDLAVQDTRKEIMEDLLDAAGMAQSRDSGVGEGAATTTAFSSIMHNIVNQMLLAIKAKATADRAIEAFKAGEKPVIALANTNESFIKDFAEQEGIDVGDVMDLDFGAVLRRYLSRTLRVTIKPPEGEKEYKQISVEDLPMSMQAMYREAEAIIDGSDFSGLPISPIDAIRHRLTLAGMSVAEVTGRKTMLDYSGEAGPVYAQRPKREQGPSGKRSSIAAFNAGKLDALILNRSGSTGVSMHASERFADQRRRRMILAQAEGNIDTHLQMLGRVHRTGQVIPPAYSQIAAEIPAEARPTAVLMRKMASLNANTTGARGSVFMTEAVDFMNEVGDKVVAQYMADNPEIEEELGGDVVKIDKATGLPTIEDAAKRVTGRLVLLPPDKQAEMLDGIQSAYQAAVEELDALGDNPLEAKTLDLAARTVGTTEIRAASGESPFLAATTLEEVTVKAAGRAMSMDDVAAEIAKARKLPAPEGDPLDAIETMAAAASGQTWKRVSDLRERALSWADTAFADLSAEAQPKARERFKTELDRLVALNRYLYPGSTVSIGMPAGDMTGIVLSFERTGKAKSPAALGAWTLTVAVPDSMRVLKLSGARLFPPSSSVPTGDKGATIAPARTSREDIAAEFDKARLEGRETRYVVTGNILAGFEQVNGKGRIVNFTMEDGTLRPGILLGREFKKDKFLEKLAVRFSAGQQVVDFLDQAPERTVVTSTDGNIKIGRDWSGYVIQTPAARATGGRYYTDPDVRNALGANEFVKSGSFMFARRLRGEQVARAVDAMRAAGATFETRSNQDIAKKITQPAPAQPVAPGPLDDLNAALAEAETERPTRPEFADYGSYQRFRGIRNVLARNAGRRVHENMLDPAEFELALANLFGTAREGQITTGELRQTVEAITGRPVGRMTWRRLEIELREEAKRRGRDLRHSQITGFPLEFAPSNLDPTDAVMDDLERLSERLPESVGVYIAPVLRTALSRVRNGGDGMAARAGLDTSPEARKARAEAMGFDTSRVLYHGTMARPFKGFQAQAKSGGVSGVYLSPNASVANFFAGEFERDSSGGYVVATHIRGRVADFSDASVVEAVGSAMDRMMGWPEGRGQEQVAQRVRNGRMDWAYAQGVKAAQAAGFDAVNLNDADGPSVVVFDPTNIRSVNAAFDEVMTDSADLMAALGPEMRWDAHRGRWVSPERTTPEAAATWSEVLDGLPVSEAERKRLDRLVQQARTKSQQRGSGMAAQAAGGIEFEGVSLAPSQAMGLLGIDPGNYRRVMALSLAYGPDVAMQTFTHEEVHTLRAIGALSEQQWSTLAGIARKKPRAAEARRILEQMRDSGKIGFREHAAMVKRAGQITMREIYSVDRRYRGYLEGMVPQIVRDAGQEAAWVEDKLLEEVVAHAAADWADGRSYGTKIDRVMFVIRDFIEAMGNFLRGNGYTNINQVFQSIWSGQVARQFDERNRADQQRDEAVQRWMADNDVSAMAVRPGATPEQMFSLADRDTGRSMRRDMDALGYYSKLDEVLAGLGPKDKVTADTLQKRGVKAAEMEARGLMPMLADGKAVSVADLRETAGRNRVEMRESQRFVDPNKAARRQLRDQYNAQLRLPRDQQNTQLMAELESRLDDMMDEFAVNYEQYEPKWSNYSLDPSNPTYRETVLHLPESKVDVEEISRNVQALRARVTEPGLSFDEMLARRQEADRAAREMSAASTRQLNAVRADFRSGHFPEPNIVGHMMTSMVRHEGKPVYLIDQIQSDWGQKLRDGGVRDEAKIAELKSTLSKIKTVETPEQAKQFLADADRVSVSDIEDMFGYSNDADYLTNVRRTGDRIQAEIMTAESAPAGNPLVNTTDQWVNTTLRRAIRQAAEADAAFIAIPSGKTVESYNPQGDSAGNAVFYDQIVPKNLRNLLSRIDKDAASAQRVDTLETPTQGQAGSGFTLFPLTEKVRRSVIDDGQVMFALRDLADRSGATLIDDIGPNDPSPSRVLAFHGTGAPSDFDKLALPPNNEFGVHFGTTGQADYFSRLGRRAVVGRNRVVSYQGGRVLPSVIYARNVVTTPDLETWFPDAVAEELATNVKAEQQFPGLRKSLQPVLKMIADDTEMERHAEIGEALRAVLAKHEIEAIRYRNTNEGEGWSYMVWDEGRVQSATSGDIMFAFAGERAKTADLKALARAKEMEAAGTDRTSIWTETGWFRGVDGKWRFEIDDSGAQVYGGEGYDLFQHSLFRRSYPQLTSIEGNVQRSDVNRGRAQTRQIGDEWEARIGIEAPRETWRSVGVHELQHVGQDIENFAQGGSPRRFTPAEIAAERARMASATDDGWTSVGTYDPSISDQQIAMGLYNRLAGEVEARAVQKRLDMTPAERRARPPWMDYDVPEDQQIVRFADGSGVSQLSYSAPPPVEGFPTMASDVMFAIRAFHGSPYDFDRFDMSKIGTGEGEQAYGYGLYFAENEQVALDYKFKLSRNKNKQTGDTALDDMARKQAEPHFQEPEGVRERLARQAEANAQMAKDLGMTSGFYINSKVAELLRNPENVGTGSILDGRLYEVRINAEPDDFLDLNAPLGRQSNRVRAILEPMLDKDAAASSLPIAQTLHSDQLGRDAVASFRNAGVAGIRYLDQVSREAGEGSRNYVIFDDSLIEIVAKDGKPIGSAERKAVVDSMTARPEGADGSGPMFALREIEQTWGPKWDIYMGQQYRIAEAGYDYATMYDILAGKLSKASGIEPAMRAAMQAKMRELYDDMGPEGRAAAGIKELPPQDALDGPMAALAGQEPPDPSLDQAITELKEALGVAQAGGTSGNALMRFLRRAWSPPAPAAVAQGLRGVTVRQDDREMRLRPRSNVRGQTDRATGLMTVRQSRDLETIAHEGGHGLEQLIGTPLDEVKAEHWRDLIPAVDEVPPPMAPTGYSGMELDAYEQGLLTIAAQRAYELRDAAAASGTSVGQRLSAAAIGALIGGSFGASLGTAIGNQIGGPVGGMAVGTVAATVGMAAGGIGRMSSVDRASKEPAKVAAVLMAEAHANLARAVGTRKADALLDDVVAETRDDVASYVAGRFSPTGTPRTRIKPAPDAPALSEAFARWFERYVMDPDGAKKDAPNFHAAFEDTLDAEVPGVTEALAQVQQTYRAYMMQAPLERAAADVVSMNAGNSWERLAEDGSFENIQGKLRSAYNGIYDHLNPVWHVVRKLLEVADRNGIRDENGRRISLKVAENPYKLMRMFGNSFNRGRMWLEAGIADLGQTDIKGPSLLAALEVAYGGRERSQWTPAIHQEFGAYLISRRAVAEYDRLARKKAALEAMDRTLVAAREQRSELVAEAAQERGVLARREDALIRAETRLTDTKREMRSAETTVRNLEERLRQKADDILAAQMARNGNLETRRRREMQTMERDARREVRRFEAARDTVSELEIERTMLTSEIEQRRASVEDMETRLREFDEAVDALRAERQRTEKRGASRPPTLQPRDFHTRIISEFEAKYPGGEGVGDFREAARLVYEWTHRLLTLRYQAGFISNELYEELTTRKGFYVPFQRDMSDMSEGDVFMRGGAGKWSPFKKFDGSDRAIINPLEALSQQAYTTAQQIAFNDAIGMLAKLAQRVGPGGAQIAEVLPRTETLPANENTIDRIIDLAISMGYDPADAHHLVSQMEQNFSDADVTLVWSETNKSPVTPPQLPYWVNGERQLVRLNDPVFGRDMFNAINGMGEEMSNVFLEMAATSARWLRAGVTTHPNFIFRNLLRDIPSAFIRAGVTPFKGHMEGLRILRNNEAEVAGTGLEREDFLRLYNEAGGIVGGQNVASIAQASQRYDVLDLRNTGPMGVGVNKIFHVVEAIETAGRLGIAAHAYRRAIEHNPNLTQMEAMQEAAFVSRDVYDWGRRGSKMLALNRLVTFLNAALQSTESALRGLTGQGDRGAQVMSRRAGGTLAGSMAVGVGAGALVAGPPGAAIGGLMAAKAAQHLELVLRKESDGVISEAEERDIADAYKTWFRLSAVTLFFLLLYAAMKDDPWHEDIKDGTKSTHSWMKLSTLGSVINHRIDQGAEMLGIKPQKDAAAAQVAKALGMIGTEWAPDWLRRYLQVPNEWRIPKPFEWALPGNIAEVIYDGIEGRDPRMAERIRATAWEVLAPPGLPQAALVGVGAYAGYDLRTKRDIVPDRLKKLTPHEQFDAFSSQMAIDLSKAIYDLGAKVGMKPERAPSPKMIDWVLSNQGAYWGKDIANAYDVAKRAAGLSNREAGSVYDMWIVAGITGRGYRNSKSIEEFWKLHGQEGGKMATAFQTYKSMIDESGQPERAAEFLARLEPEERAYALLRYHHRASQPFGVSHAEASHPLVRAAAVHKIQQDIRKDMILGRLVESKQRGARDFETNIVLSPTKQAEVHDILERLSQIEVRNSMILLERDGWKGRPYLDPKPVLDELRAASEPVFDVYEAAVSKARVRDWDDVREVWPINRRELLQNGADASLQ